MPKFLFRSFLFKLFKCLKSSLFTSLSKFSSSITVICYAGVVIPSLHNWRNFGLWDNQDLIKIIHFVSNSMKISSGESQLSIWCSAHKHRLWVVLKHTMLICFENALRAKNWSSKSINVFKIFFCLGKWI